MSPNIRNPTKKVESKVLGKDASVFDCNFHKKFVFLQITFGRNASDMRVDIDFSLEGPTWKISRRHGMIKMTNEGKFMLHNQGRRPVFINGAPVVSGSVMQLQHNSALEVSTLGLWSPCTLYWYNFGSVTKTVTYEPPINTLLFRPLFPCVL